MIGVGAGLGHYTTEGGYLYPGARTVQIDINPRGLWQGLRTADLHVRADAKAAAEAIAARLKARGYHAAGFRSADMAQQIAERLAGLARSSRSSPTPSIRARRCVELDAGDPQGLGHRGRRRPLLQHRHDPHEAAGRPSKYHVVNEFGAIGSGLPAAIGIAAARGDGKVHADRGRRQPADAHPGAGDDPPPGHPHADLGR